MAPVAAPAVSSDTTRLNDPLVGGGSSSWHPASKTVPTISADTQDARAPERTRVISALEGSKEFKFRPLEWRYDLAHASGAELPSADPAAAEDQLMPLLDLHDPFGPEPGIPSRQRIVRPLEIQTPGHVRNLVDGSGNEVVAVLVRSGDIARGPVPDLDFLRLRGDVEADDVVDRVHRGRGEGDALEEDVVHSFTRDLLGLGGAQHQLRMAEPLFDLAVELGRGEVASPRLGLAPASDQPSRFRDRE